MAEGEFASYTDRIQQLERTVERLTSQAGTGVGQQETQRLQQYDTVIQDQRQYIERLEQQVRALDGTVNHLLNAVRSDAVLATALTQAGLQVGNTAITDLSAAKLTGTLATAVNIANSWNNGTGYDATKLTTGAVPTAALDDNVIAAVNASAGGGNFAKFSTGDINTSGTLTTGNASVGQASISGALDHNGSAVGFYGVAPATQQAVAALTNNLTATGTPDTISNWTPSGAYGTDQQAIYDAIANLARKVSQAVSAHRTTGLFG